MSLTTTINADIKAAMLAKEKEKLEALRAIKSAILLANTEKNAGEISEEDEIKLLKRLVKQRKESAATYSEAGRNDLAEKEEFQASLIETYLPEQLGEEEIEKIIDEIIAETNADSMKDMGRIMGMAVKKTAGKADNKILSEIIKKKLS
jgi:uncharacterized protein YqeY